MSAPFGIIDLFAGPGGLGEGFASLRVNDHTPFQIVISVEKERSAHRTLTLRAFLRIFLTKHNAFPQAYLDFHAGFIPEPDWSEIDPIAWQQATAEARRLELGTIEAARAIDQAIGSIQKNFGDKTVLIGGPPCQAYSLVGRARIRSIADYVPEKDERHYLFREYIGVLDQLRPAAFVMENVKGMLSSTVKSQRIFEMLMEDLTSLGRRSGHHYELHAIRIEDGKARLRKSMQPSDFVVRAEEFGVPQRRHRVIIIGIRADLAHQAEDATIPVPILARTVNDVIGMMPAVRSGLSRGKDSAQNWRKEVFAWMRWGTKSALRDEFIALARQFETHAPEKRTSSTIPVGYGKSEDSLLNWLERPMLRAIAQHETRGHMAPDLGRYLFAAVFGRTHGRSPKAADFPPELSPDHYNWRSGIFSDRFRVQLAHAPSTTVTSHISKDGHYFIHPDPLQCRSLTVREAARLQTFPDDYLFLGPRTDQYIQVGNAVPPFLARQIAALVHAALSSNPATDE